MDIFEMLGLAHGDAHVIRNAGGRASDPAVAVDGTGKFVRYSVRNGGKSSSPS